MDHDGLVMENYRMNWRDHIVSEPDVLLGKPTIRGTRISIELILGWLSKGWTFDTIIEAYPFVTRNDILAALAFAAEMLHDERYISIYKCANPATAEKS